MGNYLQKMGLILAGIFFGLIGVEIFGRLFSEFIPYPIQNSMQMGSLAKSDPSFGIIIIPGQAQIKNPEFSHTIATRDVGCHQGAFRDDGMDDKKPRILALGDSFTWGAGVANEETWPEVLEQQTRSDVINAGYPGTGTQQQLILLRECGLMIRPDITIVAFFINDFSDNVVWRQRLGIDNYWYTRLGRPVRVWLAANSYTFQFFKYYILGPLGIGDFQNIYWSAQEVERRFIVIAEDNLKLHLSRDYTAYFKPDFYLYDRAIPLVHKTLSEMAQESEKLNSKFLLVVLPAKEQVYWQYLEPSLPANYQVNLPTNIVVNLAQENQIPVLDLRPVFVSNSHKQLYWDVDGHMNAAGYRLIAESVKTYLLEKGWLTK